MTTREEEIREQRNWKLKPALANYNGFDELVTAEFLSPSDQDARLDKRLRDLLSFCALHVPFYQAQWKERGIDVRDISHVTDLAGLPILSKHDIQSHGQELMARQPPEGHKAKYKIKTTGTTGKPVTVAHSQISRSMNTLLKQRQLRWFRYDPMGLLAQIRPASDLPRNSRGELLSPGEACFGEAWPLVGQAFHTGKFVGFDDSSDARDKVAFLEQHQPDYLLGQSAQLEQLALVSKDIGFTFRLRGIEAISQQLTPDMTEVIESILGTTVHMNYGLNEVGIVAARCPEGNRYHIHTENCVAEIVDAEGAPCRPGESGRLLVTALTNLSMPLVRYDTDDLAEASEGPCPCGRTLPTFREIHGRYRRTALLPPGVWNYWTSFQRCLRSMSVEQLRNLHQYQLKHHRDGSFTLNIVVGGTMHADFEPTVRERWQNVQNGEPAALTIRVVDEIARPRGGKFQSFISEYFPDYREPQQD